MQRVVALMASVEGGVVGRQKVVRKFVRNRIIGASWCKNRQPTGGFLPGVFAHDPGAGGRAARAQPVGPQGEGREQRFPIVLHGPHQP